MEFLRTTASPMACFGQSITAFSSVFPSRNSTSQEDQSTHRAEAEVLLICACAGVSCIGITADRVLFQPVVTSISIPLAEFQDHERATTLIKAKLAEVQR